MKVADVMQKYVDFITPENTVFEASRLIFGRGINGLPVCRNKKVVGFVTERDILSKFYPSTQEYVEDIIRSSDFEGMEDKVNEILEMTVDKIMTKNPSVMTEDMPLLRVQSLMFIHKVGRFPVVDKKGNLIGIISKGDIFKAIVGKKVSLDEEEGFFDWLGEYYDELYNWKERLDSEIPGLVKIFHKEKVVGILDVASSTGEHSIALAKQGFRTVGIEISKFMHGLAQKKQRNLHSSYQDKITLLTGFYKKTLDELPFRLDAAIFMGNALPTVLNTEKDILKDVVGVLNKENPVLVFQLLNFNKIFKVKNGFRDFNITEPGNGAGPKHALLSFYTKGSNKDIFISRAVFSLAGHKWIFRGIRSTPVIPMEKKDLVAKLRRLGFSEFSCYGSSLYEPIFKHSFKPLDSDWLNVIAKK